MINVGIIGATGYTAAELIRLLNGHPQAKIIALGARDTEKKVSDVHSGLYGIYPESFVSLEIENFKSCDIVFLALPHGTSSKYAYQLRQENIKVIDLGADFRLNDVSLYEKWYGSEHHCKQWMESTVYGLPEIHRELIKESNLVANPGCFPTSIILGLAPLCKNKMIDPRMVVVNSYSGLSGAGKSLTESSHFVNVNENLTAYNIGKHRHLPEIMQEVNGLSKDELKIVFNPHLAPINRGILSTITFELIENSSQNKLDQIYKEFYENEYFIRYRGMQNVSTKWVMGTNFCDISCQLISERTVVITSGIDNLIKGASGQAIQNMNLMFGFDEKEGLELYPVCP